MEFKGDNKELFQKITITANNLLYQSITVGGFLFDEFRLLKKRNGQCKFIELNPLAK
jgi:hypothetical protein